MRQWLVAGFAVAALGVAMAGCGETTACEEAESKGRATHACYVENRQSERELQAAEEHLNRVEGVSKSDEEAEERKEFREGWEEAEREQEFWGE